MYPQQQGPNHIVVDPERALGKQRALGCPVSELRQKLRSNGLRPTFQRMSLGLLLFGRGDRHVSADSLYAEAQAAKIPASLATVYNCLRVFTEAGLIRPVFIEKYHLLYDTNTSDHHHFVREDDGTVIDIPSLSVDRESVPGVPDGMEIVDVQVILKVRPVTKAGRGSAS